MPYKVGEHGPELFIVPQVKEFFRPRCVGVSIVIGMTLFALGRMVYFAEWRMLTALLVGAISAVAVFYVLGLIIENEWRPWRWMLFRRL